MWKNEERDAKCGKLYKILFYEATFVAAKINECDTLNTYVKNDTIEMFLP